MPLTTIGLNVPAGTDAFDPQVDFSDLAASLIGRTIVPVANLTERGALATAVGPTASKPLIVVRGDAPVYRAIEYTFNGSTWYGLADLGTLPDPVTGTAPGTTNQIVATAWAVLPGGDFTIPLTLARPAWVHVEMSAWLVKTAASDLRAGVSLSGATTLNEEVPQWSQTLFAGASFPTFGGTITATKVVKFGAGTTTARMRAYLAATAGASQVNYARMTLTPLRWAD